MKKNILLRTTILLVLIYLALFPFISISASAQCTGDFNSDSQVNFSDLLIFAVAYNTTSSDAKYNPLCDLNSDNAINFSDLLIFAVNYGQVCSEPKIESLECIPYTGHNSRSNSIFPVSREIETSRVCIYPEEVTNNSLSRGEIFNAIELIWNGYPDCQGFYLYRSVNGAAYEIIRVLDLGDSADITSEYYFGTWDIDIEQGSTYRYYITAYNNTENWETAPSDIFTIEIGNETFLPPVYLQQPPDYAIIEETDYLFQWTPIGNIVPYGDVAYGDTYIRIFDADTYSSAMTKLYYDDFTTSQVTYDGISLIPGKTYIWYVNCYGYDSNEQVVAVSDSEVWEFTYEGPLVVSKVYAQAITYQATSASMDMFQKKIDQLAAEGEIPDSYQLNELVPASKGITERVIDVSWHSYPDAIGYKVYRSVNGVPETIVFQDEPITSYNWYGFYDYDVSEGNSYTYYVTAYGSGWESDPSYTVTIDTWLPPCSLVSPADESIVTDPTPTFTWNPVGLTPGDFPYGSIVDGESDLWIYDQTANESAWYPWFDDMTTSSATYNQDGQAISLQYGHTYLWESWGYGYEESGHLIAYAWSEYWDFIYSEGEMAGVTDIEAETETYVSESMMMQYSTEIQHEWPGEGYLFNEPESAKAEANYGIIIWWQDFCEDSDYGFRIYRSIDGKSFEIIVEGTAPIGYDWYGYYDNEAAPGSSYAYYITAYGPDWESIPSDTVTRDTWLPPCYLVSPTDQSIITDPTPTFTWDPGIDSTQFPNNSVIYGETCVLIYDDTFSRLNWIYCNDSVDIATATYNQNGEAIPLENGHKYSWHAWTSGYDENWERIAVSESINWSFNYSEK
jgi:hypothetical protein